MNKEKKFLGLLLILAITMLVGQSCSKDDGGSISETDIALAQDEAFADALFEEVDNVVSDEIATLDVNAYSTTILKSTADDDICRTVTVDHPDSISFPKVVTIDYGDGCTTVFRNDTITRKGQIIITVTDRWFIPGAQHIVTFHNFYMNDVHVEGTRTITNMGLNEDNNLEIAIVLETGKLTFNDSTWMTRESNHLREWIRYRTPQNDTLFITGSASGMNVLGETYNRIITDPLTLVHCPEYKWRWVIVDGSVEVTNSTTGTTFIDYKAEGCEGIVIINKNGYRHNYEFKYNQRQQHHKGGR